MDSPDEILLQEAFELVIHPQSKNMPKISTLVFKNVGRIECIASFF